MSLLFNMLSRLVITFLPRSKRLLISWLLWPSAVILEPPKIKSDTVSTSICSDLFEVMGPDAMILVFCMGCSLSGSSVHGILQARKNTRVGSHSLLQGIFLIQGLNLGVPHCRQILHLLSHQGSPIGERQINKQCCDSFRWKWRDSATHILCIHSPPKERQCQRMFKLPHNCTHLTR